MYAALVITETPSTKRVGVAPVVQYCIGEAIESIAVAKNDVASFPTVS